MTIFRKDHLATHLAELDAFYQRLRSAVEGIPGPAEIDLHAVDKAVQHFKVEVESLKRLKQMASKPVHRA